MMRICLALLFTIGCIFSLVPFTCADESATIELFSPQNTVKNVRQVTARFSEQMVPFGDPRLTEPFAITCPAKGSGRWADARNWVYDFDEDLPAGISCTFVLKDNTTTLSGKPVEGKRSFTFSTGGPAIRMSNPREGRERIAEDQVFILVLDANADEQSVLDHVYFSVEGINEKIGIRILKGEERKTILDGTQFRSYLARIVKRSVVGIDAKKIRDEDLPPMLVIQAKQRFPGNAVVKLVWGAGVRTTNGIATSEDQVLPFKSREPFSAKFSCSREKKGANCIPLLPMTLTFTGPVAWETASKIVLKGPRNTVYAPAISSEDSDGQTEKKAPEFVDSLTFLGPFPEKSSFVLDLPKNLKDDAGRSLINQDRYPLQVKTDAFPPLAKFPARFGIVELKGDAALPVTLRNLEPTVKTRVLPVDEEKPDAIDKAKSGVIKGAVAAGEAIAKILPDSMKQKATDTVEGLKGKLHKVNPEKEAHIIAWLRTVGAAGRQNSILKSAKEVKEFGLPKPGGAKAFEVVGIPLKEPGFYVVEMESSILGASLLAKPKPVYVPTAALVTNLSAHFKWGRESSHVWVTSLDTAEPVANAAVTVRDCRGSVIWSGTTGNDGQAKIAKQLPRPDAVARCERGKVDEDSYYDSPQNEALEGMRSGLFVFARKDNDLTFVHSSWQRGIEPWRFNMPSGSWRGPVLAHTVFDRTLLRAGDTVHMKHIIRKHTMSGIALFDSGRLPKSAVIEHQGSDQRYEFPLKWDTSGYAETEWKIPQDVKLGHYRVVLSTKETPKGKQRTKVGGYEEGDEAHWSARNIESGMFRVEEFRVPLMQGTIQPPKEQVVRASSVELDLMVHYLSGGGASNAAVQLRSTVTPKGVSFADYEDFTFANGRVKAGITGRSTSSEYDYDEDFAGEAPAADEEKKAAPRTMQLTLDQTGSTRAKIDNLPKAVIPQDLLAELEYHDPNGEVQTVSRRIPLWPSKLLLGIRPDSWAASKDQFRFHIAAVDLNGKSVAGAAIKVDLFQRKSYSHRKRLVGGFYAYEHTTETAHVGKLCEGTTNAQGLLICEVKSPVSGNVIIQAVAKDSDGNPTAAHRDVWVAGNSEWWFDAADHDRIDLLPEKKLYEAGDTARLQVRMPFRSATALVTVEREGVIDTFVRKLQGKSPVIDVPIRKNYAPNVFVSVLVVRGRIDDVKPTALVDLGKPSYKLGIAELKVGWKPHELNVKVNASKKVYRVRDKAEVTIQVKTAYGELPPKGTEVALAAVDEGLLELMPNKSWNLLEAMMGRRGYEVQTSTAQSQVVGKRHYGLKALPSGGGGGTQTTRELFDTLLLWKGKVTLNAKGTAKVTIPLNDSLTSFRIVAVASGGTGLFGTGQTSIRSSQDVMLLSGLPPMVREGDRFRAGFTVRNTTKNPIALEAVAKASAVGDLPVIPLTLQPGESSGISWDVSVPYTINSLIWEAAVRQKNGVLEDRIKVTQKVVAAVPVRIFQATIAQVKDRFTLDVERPRDAIPGKGGIQVTLQPKIAESLSGVRWHMSQYPYTCLEQRVSKAVALRDQGMWQQIIATMPAHFDGNGLLKYFPIMLEGSPTLTTYVYAIAHEAGWEIPEGMREKMEAGLEAFISGKVVRSSPLPTADLSIRKLAAIEALARGGKADPAMLSSIAIEPNLWPTSAVIDWMDILRQVQNVPNRDKHLKEAEQIIRSRLNFQGTTMGFSTEKTDYLWWLMISGDVNANRAILTFLHDNRWNDDMPRLARGSLGRQQRGSWHTTTANAWGMLAMEKFSKKFENVSVSGSTSAALNGQAKSLDWAASPKGGTLGLNWPKATEKLSITHQGTGQPWATVQSLAAIPLKQPLSSGYRIKKTLTPVQQKESGVWSKGDVIRVKLDLESQADMTWVVVSDPIPAGSNILGTGLGRDSAMLTKKERSSGWAWPAFEERSFEAFRAYYEYVPKGKWSVEYTVRLNNDGSFLLPQTRVEALYAPEMFGENPNGKMEIK